MQKYLMPTCPVCQKRYKIPREKCMILRFTMADGSHPMSMHVPHDRVFCDGCAKQVKRYGIRWATKRMLAKVRKKNSWVDVPPLEIK